MGHHHGHSCSNDSCQSSHGHGSCCCGSHHHHSCCSEAAESCDYVASFLEIADEAWMEVLKEKIKEHIKANDKKISELAAIVAEANCDRWKKKMAKESCCDTYEQKIHACLTSCCSEHCSTK